MIGCNDVPTLDQNGVFHKKKKFKLYWLVQRPIFSPLLLIIYLFIYIIWSFFPFFKFS